MYLHVRGTGYDVGDSTGDVLALQTLYTPLDSIRFVRIVRIHDRLELGLHQPGRDGGHSDVGTEVPHFLPPTLQQPCHRELGSRVEPGGGVGRDSVSGHGAYHYDLTVTDLVPCHGFDAQLSAQTQSWRRNYIDNWETVCLSSNLQRTFTSIIFFHEAKSPSIKVLAVLKPALLTQISTWPRSE